jgi:phage gpG-like protein
MQNAVSVSETEYDIRAQLAEMMLPEMIKLIDVHKVPNPQDASIEFYGELIAMGRDDYFANYGTHYQRRGISDGTMAIMQGGNWKIVGTNSPTPAYHPLTPQPKPVATVQSKSFDPSEYLRNRVSELQNDANTNK